MAKTKDLSEFRRGAQAMAEAWESVLRERPSTFAASVSPLASLVLSAGRESRFRQL